MLKIHRIRNNNREIAIDGEEIKKLFYSLQCKCIWKPRGYGYFLRKIQFSKMTPVQSLKNNLHKRNNYQEITS